MSGFLRALGVYGFEPVETIVLASLVTEDPLLLIGESGTGKTYLLNSLSEALGLRHRHYNASLVNFDDLVGFPYPDEDKTSVRFLETPATVWGAQSILVDEISRCKTEHQNRLFSLVHERRVQGIALPDLRFRWAAMNPCNTDQDGDYVGSEPLDRALADRFGFILNVGDWSDLCNEDQMLVADPSGEGRIADDGGRLLSRLGEWVARFRSLLSEPPSFVVRYACAATSALNQGGVRVSPRRSRMLSRGLVAAQVVHGGPSAELFRLVLESSLPHRAYGATVAAPKLLAAHQMAWKIAMGSETERWAHEFYLEGHLGKRIQKLLSHCIDPEVGTAAVCQALAWETPLRAAAMAFVLFPAAASGKLPLGAEAVNDLGRHAQPVLNVDGTVEWTNRDVGKLTAHPDFVPLSRALDGLRGAKRRRATQLFYCALVSKWVVPNPADLVEEIESGVRVVARFLR